MRSSALCAFLLSGAAILVCVPAGAQPRVVVRAGTRIELAVRRDPDALHVQGTLRDDLGAPMPDRAIAIAAHEAREDFSVGPSLARSVVRSESDGRFAVTFPLPVGRYVLVAHVDDEPHYRGETVTRAVQLDLAPVRLDVQVPGGTRLDLEEPDHRVEVRASSEEGGGGLSISVRDELDRPLAHGTTAADGTLSIAIRSEALGAASVGRLFVESRADDRRSDARTEVPIVRFRPTAIAMSADVLQIPIGGSATLRGRLSAGDEPLPARAVGIFDGEAHLLTTMSRADGTFDAEVAGAELEGGPRELVARFESDAPWLSSSQSPSVSLEALVPGATPWLWIVLSLALTGLALGIARALTRGRATTDARASIAPAAGVVLAQRRSILAEVYEISGRVEDHLSERPIAGAQITLVTAAGTLANVESEPDGQFRWTGERPTSGTLVVTATGYGTIEENVSLPHRGELRGMVVRLHSLRDAAWDAMRGVGAQVLGHAAEAATAREIVAAAGRNPPVPSELPALADAVERAAWARETPTDGEVRSIEDHARGISKELDAGAGSAKSP